jgi:hypothetical protein
LPGTCTASAGWAGDACGRVRDSLRIETSIAVEPRRRSVLLGGGATAGGESCVSVILAPVTETDNLFMDRPGRLAGRGWRVPELDIDRCGYWAWPRCSAVSRETPARAWSMPRGSFLGQASWQGDPRGLARRADTLAARQPAAYEDAGSCGGCDQEAGFFFVMTCFCRPKGAGPQAMIPR